MCKITIEKKKSHTHTRSHPSRCPLAHSARVGHCISFLARYAASVNKGWRELCGVCNFFCGDRGLFCLLIDSTRGRKTWTKGNSAQTTVRVQGVNRESPVPCSMWSPAGQSDQLIQRFTTPYATKKRGTNWPDAGCAPMEK